MPAGGTQTIKFGQAGSQHHRRRRGRRHGGQPVQGPRRAQRPDRGRHRHGHVPDRRQLRTTHWPSRSATLRHPPTTPVPLTPRSAPSLPPPERGQLDSRPGSTTSTLISETDKAITYINNHRLQLRRRREPPQPHDRRGRRGVREPQRVRVPHPGPRRGGGDGQLHQDPDPAAGRHGDPRPGQLCSAERPHPAPLVRFPGPTPVGPPTESQEGAGGFPPAPSVRPSAPR